MDDTNQPIQASPEPSLPLPAMPGQTPAPATDDNQAAADMVRKKVADAYAKEPDLATEESDIETVGPGAKPSKHQAFILQLINSGKPLHDINQDWHDYYQALADLEKHAVWQEFYSTHARASHFSTAIPSIAPTAEQAALRRAITQPSRQARPSERKSPLDGIMHEKFPKLPRISARDGLKSLLFGLGTGLIVLIILLFSFFNERFIAPLIQPSRHVNNIPLISNAPVNNNPEIIIPKINVEIPVVYDVNTVDESAVDKALEGGVVHYADTALPGQDGNLVIVGHSSNNIFNPGKYKFAFVLLSKLDSGDTFYIQKDGKRYTYQVYEKKIVNPDDVSVLAPQSNKLAVATLITCDPPGTSINRLIIRGEQISPDPIANAPAQGSNNLATSAKIVPGNSPSLWSRLWSWL
jgi:LPXTG-site transpeptidase (sortase) family protein